MKEVEEKVGKGRAGDHALRMEESRNNNTGVRWEKEGNGRHTVSMSVKLTEKGIFSLQGLRFYFIGLYFFAQAVTDEI